MSFKPPRWTSDMQGRTYLRLCYRRPHFVYYQRDADGVLLYVGQTVNPYQRELLHRSSPWAHLIASTEYEMHPNAWLAMAHEEYAIKTLGPLYNVVHSPDRAASKRRIAALAGAA